MSAATALLAVAVGAGEGGWSVRVQVKSTLMPLEPSTTTPISASFAFSMVVAPPTVVGSATASIASSFSRALPMKSAPAWRSLPTTGISPSLEAVRSAVSE